MTRFVVAVLLLVCGARPVAAVPDADAVRKAVEAVGGKITLSPEGDPVEIDLYDGNNPMKGKGGRNLKVNDAWLEHLADATTLKRLNLAKLTDVNMHHTPANDAGIAAVAAMPNLKRLWVAHVHFTDAGLIRLAELKSLTTLRLTRSKQANLQSWTDAAVERLRTTRPDLTLDVK